ncbi:hypothetical protein KEM52_000397 [Ascosphaera acerosa]|nr:hypothetical protein KEM52_000397 [Ascosphaera acerosa]
MQFAVPPRKNSVPSASSPFQPSFKPSARYSSAARRRQLRSYAFIGAGILFFLYLVSKLFGGGSDGIIAAGSGSSGGPSVVIVTVLDEQALSDKYIQRIKQNREDYAKRHGYVNFFASTREYAHLLDNAPRSWASVPAVRHALTLYPRANFFWHLNPHSFITQPDLSLEKHVLNKARLEELMIKDRPVVPPDSVIKTFSHLSAKDVDLIVTQDRENLCPGSYIIRNTEWAKFFLDAWFDPLYRSYNFAKAETHALDHIVQWHPTMLAKLALIPQRIINAYAGQAPTPGADGLYHEGDLVIRFLGCDQVGANRNCEAEMLPYYQKWIKETNNPLL